MKGYDWEEEAEYDTVDADSDLRLNKNHLERCALEQATVFDKWYRRLEQVEGQIDDMKALIERKRSRIEISIRGSSEKRLWAKYGVDTLTEATVKALLASDPRLSKLNKKLLKLYRLKGRLKSIVDSARQRKSMLQILTELYVASYWDKTTRLGTPKHKRRPT